MPGIVSHRHLLDPRALADALRMLRDEESIVPVAGCTDLRPAQLRDPEPGALPEPVAP
jgi:hypothetical protein